MDSIGAVVAAILLAMLLVGGGAVAQLAYEDAGAQEEEFTETFAAGAPGETITFNESNGPDTVTYDETVVVEDKNGKEYLTNVDYEWHHDNGTLEVLDGDLANTADNTISYSYRLPTDEQTHTADAIASLLNAGMYLPLLLVVLLVLLAASALGGLA